jgi:hypothetical protein
MDWIIREIKSEEFAWNKFNHREVTNVEVVWAVGSRRTRDIYPCVSTECISKGNKGGGHKTIEARS